ncbi:MAG: hypothetical protein ACOC3D_04080 [Pseudomonadota bacterium]
MCRMLPSLLLVLLLAMPASAQESAPVGRIAALQGQVTLEGAGGRASVAGGERLAAGDRLVTGVGSRVLLQIDGGLGVVVAASSEMMVERAVATVDGPWSIVLDLARGLLRAVLTAPAEGGAVDVRTALAVTSVRSTEWTVETGAAGTAVFARDGEVTVTGNGASVVLRSGEGTDVRPGEPPTPPVAWGPPRVRTTLERSSFAGR